jgi:hypothetical protein
MCFCHHHHFNTLFFGLWAAFPLSVLICGLFTAGFVIAAAGFGYLFKPVNGGAAIYDILPTSIPTRPLTYSTINH